MASAFARVNRIAQLNQRLAELSEVAASLRIRVSEWIDSGYQNGVESPMQRYLTVGGTWDKMLSAFQSQERNRPILTVWVNGGVMAQFPDAPNDSAEWITYESARLMFAFMDSDLKHSIARCLKCGLYFERKRLQPSYKRGAYCEKHIKEIGVEDKRAKDAALRREAGATAWREWESLKRKAPDEKKWLVERINKRLPSTVDRIKQRWVTENLAEIQQRAAVPEASTINPEPRAEDMSPPDVLHHEPYSSRCLDKDFVVGVAVWRHEDALAILNELPFKLPIRYVTQEEFDGFPCCWTI